MAVQVGTRERPPRVARRPGAILRGLRHDVLTVVMSVVLALSVALFLADGGGNQLLVDPGHAVTALGTLCGLVASACMCLMLVLAARVPIIDWTIGQDRATTLHTKLGTYMVYGVLAHAVLLLIGYSMTGSVDIVSTFVQLWGSTVDFIWACVALVLLAIITVTSVVSVRRRYPYELWFALHLLTYACILASLPHMFSMSGLLAPGTYERAYWIVMWLTAAFCLLAFRVYLPLYTTLRHRLVVQRVVPVGGDAVSIEMTGRHLDQLDASGGNWMTWRFLTPRLVFEPHPFSLSAHPTDTSLRVTVRNLGAGTARLQALRPGTRVLLEGPYGVFTDRSRVSDRVVLVGAGIGIAPIRALLESMDTQPGKATVILRASTPDQLYLADEVQRICKKRRIPVVVLVGHRAGETWVPEAYAGRRLVDFVPWVAKADVYVCGPNSWMDEVISDARACGVPEPQIHHEKFDW